MAAIRRILQKKGQEVFSIAPDDTVFHALELLVENNIGSLLVMDGTRFVGIFTERDYARKVILKGKSSKNTRISEIMSTRPLSVSPDTTVQECMSLMTKKYIRHLPVVENDKLIGLVSIGDIVKYVIEEQEFIIEELEQYINGQGQLRVG